RQIEAGDRKPAVPSARGDQELIEFEPLAPPELEGTLLGVDARHRRAEPHLDLALSIEVGRPQQGLLERHPAAQVVLGERRTVVRGLGLAPDEPHPPVAALLAHGRGGSGPREPGAADRARRPRTPTWSPLPR